MDGKTNLLQETKEKLNEAGKEIADIDWIGGPNFGWFTWQDFEKVSNTEYDSGFGAQIVATDLVIVFSDGTYLKRGEYDGSEWWEYPCPIKKPENQVTPRRLMANEKEVGWSDLNEIHGNEEIK